MLTRRLRSASITTLALACSAALAGSIVSACSDTAAGPVRTLPLTGQGQPLVDIAGSPIAPGESVDATAFVVNTSRQPVRLVSAAAVPVPGYRTGKLTHLGVGTTVNMVGVGTNWPPSVPVERFAGATLHHGESRIIFAITGTQIGGNYVTAGIRITYDYQGRQYGSPRFSGFG